MVMEVKGCSNHIRIEDVFGRGDVWLCSGRSNMEMGLTLTHDAATVVPQANHPEIRLFDVTLAVASPSVDDCVGRWVLCTPKTVVEAGR